MFGKRRGRASSRPAPEPVALPAYSAWVAEHGGRDERQEDDRDAASERGLKDRRDRRDRRGGPRRGDRDRERPDRGAASADVEVVRKGEVAPVEAAAEQKQ